jgi:anti-sigma factor RsiW
MRDIRLSMFTKQGGASCVEVARTLQRYLDGDLDEATRARVANHLGVCRRCGLDENAYREIKAALARRGATVPSGPLERLRAFAVEVTAGNLPPDTGA